MLAVPRVAYVSLLAALRSALRRSRTARGVPAPLTWRRRRRPKKDHGKFHEGDSYILLR